MTGPPLTGPPPAGLAEVLPDAVIRVDDRRTIVAVNAAATTLTGHPLDGLIGKSCAGLLEPRGPEGATLWETGWHPSALLASVRSLPEQEVTLRRRDASTVRTLVTGRYLRDGQGCLTGLVLVLRKSSARMHKASSGIEVVSTVSHELRSPLTSVKGYTGLLLSRWDRIDDEFKREMLEQVKHDADRVHRLITELLDISRLETHRLVLRRQMVDLPSLVTAVVAKVRFAYPPIEVAVHFCDGFPEVYADPDKVEQVVTNLLENACKYASPEGIRIEGDTAAGAAAVTVADRGEGIPEGDLPRVFTKFFRRERGRPTGSGLGLWISRGLVEAHGGQLTATSVVDEGTAFRFTLPLTAFEELHGK